MLSWNIPKTPNKPEKYFLPASNKKYSELKIARSIRELMPFQLWQLYAACSSKERFYFCCTKKAPLAWDEYIPAHQMYCVKVYLTNLLTIYWGPNVSFQGINIWFWRQWSQGRPNFSGTRTNQTGWDWCRMCFDIFGLDFCNDGVGCFVRALLVIFNRYSRLKSGVTLSTEVTHWMDVFLLAIKTFWMILKVMIRMEFLRSDLWRQNLLWYHWDLPLSRLSYGNIVKRYCVMLTRLCNSCFIAGLAF